LFWATDFEANIAAAKAFAAAAAAVAIFSIADRHVGQAINENSRHLPLLPMLLLW
jgi:hypothetical protein